MSNAAQPRTGYVTPTRELERRWKWSVKRWNCNRSTVSSCRMNWAQWVAMSAILPMSRPILIEQTILFPAREEMLLINHGAPGINQNPPFWAPRGIKASVSLPYVQTFNFTENDAAYVAVQFIKDNRFKKIGWVSLSNLSAAFYRYLLDNLTGHEFVDATDLVDEIKAVKGPDEIDAIRKTIELLIR